MSQSAVSIADAPRSAEQLSGLGRFNLRRLAEDLGLFVNEAAKGAFMNGSNQQMGQAVFEGLTKFDAEAGKGAGTAEPKRTPVNKTKATTTPKETPAASTLAADTEQPTVGVKEILGALNALQMLMDALAERQDALENEQGTTNALVAGTNRLLVTNLVLNLMLAEEVMKGGPGRKDVLEAAVSDTAGVVEILKELDPNLVPEETEEEEEAGTEAGN